LGATAIGYETDAPGGTTAPQDLQVMFAAGNQLDAGTYVDDLSITIAGK